LAIKPTKIKKKDAKNKTTANIKGLNMIPIYRGS